MRIPAKLAAIEVSFRRRLRASSAASSSSDVGQGRGGAGVVHQPFKSTVRSRSRFKQDDDPRPLAAAQLPLLLHGRILQTGRSDHLQNACAILTLLHMPAFDERRLLRRRPQCQAPRTRSAPRSPITTQVAMVAQVTMRGMIEPSTMRRPSMPFTLRSAPTTALSSLPIRAVPT